MLLQGKCCIASTCEHKEQTASYWVIGHFSNYNTKMFGKVLVGILAIFSVSCYKYLPGAYTIRFFWIAAKYLYIKKLEKLDDKGNVKSPFVSLIRKSKCCLLECDFFGFHKNNVTYFTELDLCRTECTLNALHRYFKTCIIKGENFAFIPLASICNHFLKEMKPFQNYEMHTKIVGWGDKWLWLITVFTVDEKIKVIENRGNDETQKQVSSSESNNVPENVPPLYLNHKEGDKFGKRVYCLSLGKLVFKKGRKTLQPWDVVQLAGTSDVEVQKKGFLNEERVAQNTNNVVELLKVYEKT